MLRKTDDYNWIDDRISEELIMFSDSDLYSVRLHNDILA